MPTTPRRRTIRRGTLSPYALALARVAKHVAGCAPCAAALAKATPEDPSSGWCATGRPLVEATLTHAPEAA